MNKKLYSEFVKFMNIYELEHGKQTKENVKKLALEFLVKINRLITKKVEDDVYILLFTWSSDTGLMTIEEIEKMMEEVWDIRF
jgi:hypothetical protein